MPICKSCRHENAPGARFCTQCGQKLKDTYRWNPASLAGLGRRDVNPAPLFSNELLGGPADAPKRRAKIEPLPDGSWYCPNCGALNKKAAYFCKSCGFE